MKTFLRSAFLVMVLSIPGSSLNAEELWKAIPDPAPLPKPEASGLAPVNDIKMYYEIYNSSGGDPVHPAAWRRRQHVELGQSGPGSDEKPQGHCC